MDFPANHPRGPNGGPILLGEELCPVCECCSLSSQPCDVCGGDGYVDAESPEGWDEGDTETCDWCDGDGGWLVCLGGCRIGAREKHGPLKSFAASPVEDA